MKTFTKHNRYATASITLSDADNAIIFDNCNNAIFWLLSAGLTCREPISVDFDFFVNGFKSPEWRDDNKDAECFTAYKIFNFGSKAAIYVEEWIKYDDESSYHPHTVGHFLTRKESDFEIISQDE